MKLFKENGDLTESGLKILSKIKYDIESLFETNLVSNLSETQIRLLGSWLSNVSGNAVLNTLTRK